MQQNAPLDAIDLTSSSSDAAFDWAVRLAKRCIGADVALVSFIDRSADRVVFKAQQGLAEPWASQGGMPYSGSVARRLQDANGPLVVPDTRRHALLRDRDVAEAMGIGAYLGAPIRGLDGSLVGSISVLAAAPRTWDTGEIQTVGDLASSLSVHVQARMRAYWQARRLTEAETAARARIDMLADISHELRTPLNAVLGTAEAIALTTPDPRHRDMVALMDQAGAQLRSLADDLLAMAQSETESTLLVRSSFSPLHLVEEAAAMLAAARQVSELPVQIQPLAGADAMVRGDHRRICEVVVNLLSNALDFAPGSLVWVGIRLEPQGQDSGALLSIVVADSGPGVTDADKAAVFDRFRQGHNAKRSGRNGAGLGLAIARYLCRLHGGDLSLADTPGGGATFQASFAVDRVTL